MPDLRSKLMEGRLQPKRSPRVYAQVSCGKKSNERAENAVLALKKEERDVLTAALLYSKYPLSTY
jgi:hypothetical protein